MSKTFRRWLAIKLHGTKYATIRLKDDEIDAVAKRLGVDPDLLLEVRAQARVALHESGFSPALSNSAKWAQERVFSGSRIYQFFIWFPDPILAAWKAECELRGVHGATFLRSLIHEYLLGTREPMVAKHWSWEGKLYRGWPAKDKHPERAVITDGARRALTRRVAMRGEGGRSRTSVVRGLILEAMAGEHRGVELISAGAMFDDETRYNAGLDPHGGGR